MQPDQPPAVRVLSVGYSTNDLPSFVSLVHEAGVTAVADVRSFASSRYNPAFNGPQLTAALRTHGIVYVFLGDELGGRPRPEELYDSKGRVLYERVRETDFFRRGVERLLQGMQRFVVAMMCGEEDPLDCHRGLMITPALVERGISPLHLRRHGRLETTEEMENRLLDEMGLAEGERHGLFADQLSPQDRQLLLAEAYRRMAQKKAYRKPGDSTR